MKIIDFHIHPPGPRRALVALAAVSFALALPVSARAQTPGPTPTIDAGNAFGYKIVISGPQTSAPDQPITYTLDYKWVAAPATHAMDSLVLGCESGTLVSVTPVRGAPPTDLVPEAPCGGDLGLNGDSGTLRVIVKPPAGFTGRFSLGFDVRGTEISLPAGTVVAATTLVAPPGWMIITGAVPAPAGEHVSVEAVNGNTAQYATCDSMFSQPSPVPGQAFAPVPDATPVPANQVTNLPSYFGLIAAPSCLTSPSARLRICWSPDLPPSPPPAVDTRPCYTGLTFSEGLHPLGLLLPEMPAVGIQTPGTATPEAERPAIAMPATGSQVGDPPTRVIAAVALASLAAGAIVCGVLLRRAR